MKLTRVEISNYRSIRSAAIDIDRYTTVLMGRNDVGKSNVLKGIRTFGTRSDFERDDKCRHAEPPSANPSITVHFDSFTDDDLKALASLPISLSPKAKLTVVRKGNDPARYRVLVDDKPIRLQSNHSSPSESTPPQPQDTSILLQPSPGADTGVAEATQSAEMPAPTPELTNKTISSLWEALPSIVLFEAPLPLPRKVTIAELEGDAPKFETAKRLLALAGVQSFDQLAPEDFAEGRDFRTEISGKLKQLLQQYWLQDSTLALDINYDPPHLVFTFREATTKSTYPEQHSEATTEYVALLADILDQRHNDEAPNSLILLFDEPGIRLHPGGQRDLRLLLQGLSHKYQIIYTSHSPYLVDRNFPGQIRLITKTPSGTSVNNKPHTAQEPYFLIPYEPVRNAIGVGLGDSLIFDKLNVILEGPSDQILIGAFSQALASMEDSRYLDLNVTSLIPAGSAKNIEAIAKMAKARQLAIATLFDADEAGMAESTRLKKKAQDSRDDPTTVTSREILVINDVLPDKKPRCVEDIFPSKMYFDAVNKFYSSIYPTWKAISPKTAYFKSADKPFATMLSKYFSEELKGEFGGFDKVRVAREMAALLTEADLWKAGGQIRQDFEHAAKLLGSLKTILGGDEPEIVPETEEPKPLSSAKPAD